jgi:hypothetical protein
MGGGGHERGGSVGGEYALGFVRPRGTA